MLDLFFRNAVKGAVSGTRVTDVDAAVAGRPWTTGQLWELYEAQATSRHLDLAARRLTAAGSGYYSISSAGGEGDVAVAAVSRVTDPALPHYRSGAFYVERVRRAGSGDPVRDLLLGVVAAAADPISGGRHKVIGDRAAAIVPTTSTIASHLPRALGLAFGLDRAARLGRATGWPPDSVVLCGFGDGGANHSTATGAINAAINAAHRRIPVPVLFICLDNGIGLSVPTPRDWIAAAYASRPGLRYFFADGCDLLPTLDAAAAAMDWVRGQRRPAFLHLRTVRLFGHAGSDVDSAYRRRSDIADDVARDPLTATGTLLVRLGVSADEVIDAYDRIGDRVAATAAEVVDAAKLRDRTEVSAVIAPLHPDRIERDAARQTPLPAPPAPQRITAPPAPAVRTPAPAAAPTYPDFAAPFDGSFGARPDSPASWWPALGATEPAIVAMPESGPEVAFDSAPVYHAPADPEAADDTPATLAQAVNRTLRQLLDRDDDLLVFGEDVGRKGGVYGVTKGLQRTFGGRRVFDTPLDEQTVLGVALGTGLAGFLPIPEIQYLAYVHNALDQIRGEAATMSFFSAGQFRNPMVVRIAAYAYQKGFGGHFHNDNSVAALRDIPGLIVASPSRPEDAAAMLRTCVGAARVDGRVSVFLEPIALYHTQDLYASGDREWLSPTGTGHVPVGRARCHGDGSDLTIVTFANGVPMSLRVAQRLARQGIRARVLDLRWLAPLPVEDLLVHAHATGRVLVADETRRSGGVSEAVVTALVDGGYRGALSRVTSADSFGPLGPASATVWLSEDEIESAAIQLMWDVTGSGGPSRP
ncbi:MFS transporter [Nocardia stercoris]|uniref:MFS transporter n=2 Tax=Nocardia stercoris TaxID=2483361 RepID=A0A3M2KRI9_9NOCA|nr:MFS transporter [Nocardia stercoris]